MTTTAVQQIQSARKNHLCSWCGEGILEGSPYSRYRYYDGGDASTVKMHNECEKASRELVEKEGAIEFSMGDHPRGCNCSFDPGCPHCMSAAA